MTHQVRDNFGHPIPALRPGSTQRVAVGAASTSSTALQPGTEVVRLKATTDCHIRFNSPALTTDLPLSAGETEYLQVPSGATINVIRSSADGFLFVTEML